MKSFHVGENYVLTVALAAVLLLFYAAKLLLFGENAKSMVLFAFVF